MPQKESIATPLAEEDVTRVDALAGLYRITRHEMIARIITIGLLVEERQARETRARGKGAAS